MSPALPSPLHCGGKEGRTCRVAVTRLVSHFGPWWTSRAVPHIQPANRDVWKNMFGWIIIMMMMIIVKKKREGQMVPYGLCYVRLFGPLAVVLLLHPYCILWCGSLACFSTRLFCFDLLCVEFMSEALFSTYSAAKQRGVSGVPPVPPVSPLSLFFLRSCKVALKNTWNEESFFFIFTIFIWHPPLE